MAKAGNKNVQRENKPIASAKRKWKREKGTMCQENQESEDCEKGNDASDTEQVKQKRCPWQSDGVNFGWAFFATRKKARIRITGEGKGIDMEMNE